MRWLVLTLTAVLLSACQTSTTVAVTSHYTPPPTYKTAGQLYRQQPAVLHLRRSEVARGSFARYATARVFGRNPYGICREQWRHGGLTYVCYDKRWLDRQPFGALLRASKQGRLYAGLEAPVYTVGWIRRTGRDYNRGMATYRYRGRY